MSSLSLFVFFFFYHRRTNMRARQSCATQATTLHSVSIQSVIRPFVDIAYTTQSNKTFYCLLSSSSSNNTRKYLFKRKSVQVSHIIWNRNFHMIKTKNNWELRRIAKRIFIEFSSNFLLNGKMVNKNEVLCSVQRSHVPCAWWIGVVFCGFCNWLSAICLTIDHKRNHLICEKRHILHAPRTGIASEEN